MDDKGKPDRVAVVCDMAFGGGDNLSMPIAYVYGDEVYVHDVALLFVQTGKKQAR